MKRIDTLFIIILLLTQSVFAQQALEIKINTGIDDVELRNNIFYSGSSDLELNGLDGGYTQTTYLRFRNINLPSDAEITSAYLEFNGDENRIGNSTINIYGEIGNSEIFTNTNNLLTRNYTTSSVVWETTGSVVNQTYHTPNISSLLESMFSGIYTNINLGFKIEGNQQGGFTVDSYEGGNMYAPKLVIYYNSMEGESISVIDNGYNDAEQFVHNGQMFLGSGVLEIGGMYGSLSQLTALRFENVQIPENASISDAYLEFYSYGTSVPSQIFISSELENNTEIYNYSNNNIDSRNYTETKVLWNTDNWTTSNQKHRTNNLKNIIDLVRLNGWSSGGNLAFKLEGNSNTRVWGRDGSVNLQPRLIIKYLNNGGGASTDAESDPANMTELYINEISSNGTSEQSEDWVELYNNHDYPIYIEEGVYLSDKASNKTLNELQEIYIPAKGFVTFIADGSPELGKKHLDFKLKGSGEQVYLTRMVDENLIDQDEVIFQEFEYNETYGRIVNGIGEWSVLLTPTYNMSNENAIRKLEIAFSQKRGLYPTEFQLTLSTEAGSTIKYTTDGSYPTENSGLVYSGPISINKNTVVKAFSYSSTGMSPIISNSYFLENNLANENGWQYKETLNNQEYATALKEIPIVSISGNSIWFDRNYKETSFEYIDNQLNIENETFFSNSGTKKFGQWSYGLASSNYKVKFHKDFGVKKAKYPFFTEIEGEAYPPSNEISKMEFKEGEDGPQGNWFGLGYARISEDFIMNTLREMDTYTLYTQFVHLYMNGNYYGVRTMRDDFNANNMEEYFGDDDDNYTEVNLKDGYWSFGIVEQGDGDSSKWTEIRNLIQSRNFQGVKQKVDIDGYIKQLMIYVLFDMENEAKAIGHNQAPNYTKFRFMLNDTDGALWKQTAVNCGTYLNKWNSSGCSINGPAGLAGKFIGTDIAGFNNYVQYTTVGNLEFKTMIKDRILNYMQTEGGALTTEVLNQKIVKAQNMLDTSYKMDAAYKGFQNNAYTLWKQNLIRIQNEMPARVNFVLNKWIQKDLAHTLTPVIINSEPKISIEDTIEFINTNTGTQAYYTLNGTDPMGNDGVISPEATVYNEGFSIVDEGEYTITVRAFKSNNWGPISQKEIVVLSEQIPSILLTGINYNPSTSEESEFLLFTNSSEQNSDISNYTITEGVVFEFPLGTLLEPNETIVVAKDIGLLSEDFDAYQKHQWTSGKLSNGGELIRLENTSGIMIDEVSYSDVDPWDTLADGEGYYLKLISIDLNNDLGENWEAVTEINEANKSSVEDIETIKVFPNPFDEGFNITFDKVHKNVTILVYDLSGNLMLAKKRKNVSKYQRIEFNTSNLKVGMFYVKVISDTDTKTIAIIKKQ